MTDELNKVSVPLDADFKIPDTIQFADSQTQEQFNKNLKEYNLEDLKLTARKKLILIDSVAAIGFGDPSDGQPYVDIENTPGYKFIAETKAQGPDSVTTSTVINGNTIFSATSVTTTPMFPVTEPLPTFKRKKSDRPVTVSIKDQLKKKARRKLAAASKRKNR